MSPAEIPTSEEMVAGLIAKRQEIARTIGCLQEQVRSATFDLDRIEATLRLFKPDIDLGEMSVRPVPPAHHAFRGEVTRIVFAMLRRAGVPVSTGDLAAGVMNARGLPSGDLKLRRVMLQRVGAMLAHWRGRGVLRSSPGPEKMLLWEIVNRKGEEE